MTVTEKSFPYVTAEIAFPFDPGISQQAYQQEVLRDLPAAYYRLRAAAGPFPDLSAYAHAAGAITGTVTPANIAGPITGEGGSAPRFNGSTGFLTLPSDTVLDAITGLWSIEAWVYPTSLYNSDQAGIFTKLQDAGNTTVPWSLGFGNPSIGPNVANANQNVNGAPVVAFWDATHGWSALSDGVSLALNTWTHLVGVWTGTGLRLYRNGALAASSTVAISPVASPAGTASVIGRRWNTAGVEPYFPGGIAEAGLYNYALSADRVSKHYAARTNANPAVDVASLPWRNVTPKVRQVGTSRGRQRELDKTETGTAGLRLDNTDRRFEPEYQGVIANHIRNPSVEIDLTDWSPGANQGVSTGIRIAGAAPGGRSWAGRNSITGTTGGAFTWNGPFGFVPASNGVPVAAGDVVYASAQAIVISRAGAGGSLSVMIRFYDASATIIADATAMTVQSPVTNAWTQLWGTAVAPAGATLAVAFIYFITGPTAGSYVWDADTFLVAPVANVPDPTEYFYVDGVIDNGRWAGTPDLSKSYWGGPYYPNMIPMRRGRVRAAWPPQLVPNGSFERSATVMAPWVPTLQGAATAQVQNTAEALAAVNIGSWFNHLEMASPAGSTSDAASVLGDLIPVDPSKSYALSAYFYAQGTGTPMVAIRCQCYDDTGVNLGVASWVSGDAHFQLNGLNQWEKHGGVISGMAGSGQAAWPIGTKYARVEIFGILNAFYPAFTGAMLVDDVALTPGTALFADTDYYAAAEYDYNANDAWFEMYNGYLEQPDLGWTLRKGLVDLAFSDAFEPMGTANISVSMPQHLSGTRIAFTLDAGGYPRSERVIQAGQLQVQAAAFANNLTEPTTHLQDVADTEGGICYVGADGKVHFEDKNDRTSGANATSRSTFGDGGQPAQELPYVDLTPAYGVDRVYNYVSVTRIGGNQQIAEDATSKRQYWKRELDKSGTWHVSDADAAASAATLLAKYKQPALRFDSVRIDPTRDPKAFSAVLAREISHRITVVRRPGGPVALTRAVHVEHISHTVTLGDQVSWETEFQLSPAS